MPHPVITAIGSYVPERILSNFDLQQMVETSDEWIVQRTGIRERRIAGEHEFTSDMCAKAAADLQNRYGKSLSDADMVIAATHTPDFPFPSAACLVQEKLGIASAGAFDVNAACAGFVYGLQIAGALIASGAYRKVLVFGADMMSKITDYTDRTTCILFGDGAGAVLVEASDDVLPAFLSQYAVSDGSGGSQVYRTGLSKALNGIALQDTGRIVQNGREVYRWAVTEVPKGMNLLAEKAGIGLSETDYFVPHSANLRIIESICERSGFPLERVLHSLVRYGNTSAASIPLSLDLAVKDGRLQAGNRVLLYGFGAGLTQAGLLMKWTC